MVFYQAVRHLRLHLHIHTQNRHAEVSRILRFGHSPPRRRRGAVAGLGTVWRNWLDWGYDLRVWICVCQAERMFFLFHFSLEAHPLSGLLLAMSPWCRSQQHCCSAAAALDHRVRPALDDCHRDGTELHGYRPRVQPEQHQREVQGPRKALRRHGR
ncbi:hypothetical protein EXIGLDRAFT_221032 [Exidia glandulosa HHB12029]|uniref:Uncharacterized protein n=1 Tax=Exidia glandulosa HHB12029 TaxID=1314781 RepID=A0A165MQG7_EXIGL|nr:hypothetical protein EXIGLDRAFT_221032 [Exidia glandulosa HHB12029]